MLKSILLSFDFKKLYANKFLYICTEGTTVILIIVYVDDIKNAWNDNKRIKVIIGELRSLFTIQLDE